jgi:hypothetical protein
MKTTLQALTILLGASGILAAIAGLFGIHSSVAFLTSETAFWLYPVAGLMLIGFGDYTRRPAIILRPATKSCPAPATCPERRGNAYGIRDRKHVTA